MMRSMWMCLLTSMVIALVCSELSVVASPISGDVLLAEVFKHDSGKRSQVYLADPQSLLREHDRDKCLQTLNAHAADSKVDVYLCLLPAESSLFADSSVAGSVARVVSRDPSAVVVYYVFGVPDRAQLHAGPQIEQRIAQGLLTAILKGCIAAAAQETRPNMQLEAFVDMLVVRICSMERLLESGSQVALGNAEPVSGAVVTSEPSRVLVEVKHQWQRLISRPWSMVVALLSVGGLILLWITKRLLSRHLFPPTRVTERLGAPHAAGVGEVIAFSNPRLPPAMQRGDA
jgi:hypothetical protein